MLTRHAEVAGDFAGEPHVESEQLAQLSLCSARDGDLRPVSAFPAAGVAGHQFYRLGRHLSASLQRRSEFYAHVQRSGVLDSARQQRHVDAVLYAVPDSGWPDAVQLSV